MSNFLYIFCLFICLSFCLVIIFFLLPNFLYLPLYWLYFFAPMDFSLSLFLYIMSVVLCQTSSIKLIDVWMLVVLILPFLDVIFQEHAHPGIVAYRAASWLMQFQRELK